MTDDAAPLLDAAWAVWGILGAKTLFGRCLRVDDSAACWIEECAKGRDAGFSRLFFFFDLQQLNALYNIDETILTQIIFRIIINNLLFGVHPNIKIL